MKEEFKDIKNYEGLYQVSNLGRIKSCKRNKIRKIHYKQGRDCYEVGLCKDGKIRQHLISRLVADAFIPNPKGLKQVYHIDQNKANNNADNLAWCDICENFHHISKPSRLKKSYGNIPQSINGEEWKDIENYEGIYLISSLGRVFSCYSNSILEPGCDGGGYLKITLCKNGKRKSDKIHRIVARSFISNPNNYKEVNHKDEDKRNNSVANLEWCDRDYNQNYGTRGKRQGNAIKGLFLNRKNQSKVVCQYTLQGIFIAEYPSIAEAQRKFGKIAVSACCKNRVHSAGGFMWRYKG